MQLKLWQLLLLLVVTFPSIHARRLSIGGAAGENELINHVQGRRGWSGWDEHCCCKRARCSDEERVLDAKGRPTYRQNARSNGEIICCTRTWSYVGKCPFGGGFTTLASDLLPSTTRDGCRAPTCLGSYGVKPMPIRVKGSIEPCECEDGFQGPAVYLWDTNSWSRCQPVRCPQHSKHHPACECKHGYQGTLTWRDNNWKGDCVVKRCPRNSESWPSCKCKPGFKGSLSWKAGDYVGECKPVECPENAYGFPHCQCREGFQGSVYWDDQQAVLQCRKVECPDDASGHPKCKCNKFFSGKLEWNGAGYNGKCVKAECPKNSEGQWPVCECNKGYSGKVVWNKKKKRFRTIGSGMKDRDLGCLKVWCPPNAWHHPDCECKPGFRGIISWISETNQYHGTCESVA